MKFNIPSINSLIINDNSYEVDELPDRCPQCHTACIPYRIAGTLAYVDSKVFFMEYIFKCPSLACQKCFISFYGKSGDPSDKTYYLLRSVPKKPVKQSFSELVAELSPSFVQIFNQASESEAYGLDQVAGMGYRKALEFLIKEYCIYRNQDSKDKIEGLFLGKCIAQFVKNENIQICAERAAWIGNDESHYIKKWADKDIHDLKEMLQLTVSWIDSELRTEKLLIDMPPKPT